MTRYVCLPVCTPKYMSFLACMCPGVCVCYCMTVGDYYFSSPLKCDLHKSREVKITRCTIGDGGQVINFGLHRRTQLTWEGRPAVNEGGSGWEEYQWTNLSW